MAKKFKNFGVLGCLIAVEEMADFTLWFQQKYDFFGTSSVLTPLVALKTQPNLWKQLFLCQCTSQGPKVTKSDLLEGFKHFESLWSVLLFVCFPGDYVLMNCRILKLGHACPDTDDIPGADKMRPVTDFQDTI